MTFQPELGQALFGQPHQEHEVPDIWDAALCFIRDELERVMWNVRQKEICQPVCKRRGEVRLPDIFGSCLFVG
jgi:hypothetical protein